MPNRKLKLQVGEQLIDPRQITLTRWADRHPDRFPNQAFASNWKQEIESAGRQCSIDQGATRSGCLAEQADGLG